METTNQNSNPNTLSDKDNVRCRADIRNDISIKEKQIEDLLSEIEQLNKEDILLSDDEQWFSEKQEEFVVSQRPKKVEKHLIGRVTRQESISDEDTGEILMIDRSVIVRVDGVWR
jgi:hypothetical protein